MINSYLKNKIQTTCNLFDHFFDKGLSLLKIIFLDFRKISALFLMYFIITILIPVTFNAHLFKKNPKALPYCIESINADHPIIKYPNNIQKVQFLVKEAVANKTRITIRGEGMSQGMQFLSSSPKSSIIDLSHINRIIEIDKKNKTVLVEAGATWKQLQAAINPYELAISVQQASAIFSIGGSISTNIHGWDHTVGTIGNTVIEMTIVDEHGNIRVLTPQEPLFRKIVGGYGQFGIIVSVKMQLTTNNDLREESIVIPVEKYAEYYIKKIAPNPHAKMHLFRLSLDPRKPLLEGFTNTYLDDAITKRVEKRDLVDEERFGSWFDRLILALARKYPTSLIPLWTHEKYRMVHATQSGIEPVATRNQIMRAKIEALLVPCRSEQEWLQEYFLSQQELFPFIEELSAILKRNKVKLLNASVRIVQKDNLSQIPYAVNEPTFAVVLCYNQRLEANAIARTKSWIQESITSCLKHKGKFYLPYQHVATKEQVKEAYPNLIKSFESSPEVFRSDFNGNYPGVPLGTKEELRTKRIDI